MRITIDEVSSDIDIPASDTGEGEPARSETAGASAGSTDFTLRDAIIRLEQRELRLMAD